MGVEGTCRSLNGGGCPFLHAFHIANRHLFASGYFQSPPAFSLAVPAFVCLLLLEYCYSLSPPAFHPPIVAEFQIIRAKRGQNQIFICSFLSNLGKIGDNNVQKPNIFLKCGVLYVCRLSLSWWCFIVSTRCRWCRGGRGFEASGPAGVLALVLLSCVPLLLSALLLCLWCVVFEYGSISRSKGVFSDVWGCCVGLCGLRALRGLWGFVRVWS